MEEEGENVLVSRSLGGRVLLKRMPPPSATAAVTFFARTRAGEGAVESDTKGKGVSAAQTFNGKCLISVR